jgi:ECF transporter S component (folate family)
MKFNIKILCQVALLVAVEIVLNRFASINTSSFKIGFSFLPIALCGMLFGPVWAAVAGALADFLGANLFPIGVYFPGFTLVAALSGAVFGLLFYGKESPRFFPEIVCATLINCLVFGLFVNTYWISLLYDSNTYWGYFIARLTTQYVFLVPVHLILLPLLPKLARPIRRAGFVE